MLKALGPMADIGGLLGRAFGIGQHRQIAARPQGVHVIEEKCAVTAKQVLYVVLRRRERDINSGLIHQKIEQMAVEGQRRGALLVFIAVSMAGSVQSPLRPFQSERMLAP